MDSSQPNDSLHLRPFWSARRLVWGWRFGLVLMLLFGIPRFILVLQANVSGKFNWVSIVFVLMWLAPFAFLSKNGRKKIGLARPHNYTWLLLSFLLGAVICCLLFLLADLLFADSISNWFAYMSRPFTQFASVEPPGKLTVFIVSAIVSMTFSPVGEEILYRGMIHESIATDLGDKKAANFESMAFALTHLAHFGIVYDQGGWSFLPLAAFLWVVAMFLTSRLFLVCKMKTQSLAGAILCHAGFNLAMMYLTFYHIL